MKLARNGHLSDLSIERIVAGEDTHSHIQSCEICKKRIETIRNQTISIPPMRLQKQEVENKKRKLTSFILPGLVISLVALVALFSFSPKENLGQGGNTIRIKGTPFTVSLYANDEQSIRPLHDGALVHPNERIGFRVESKIEGYLSIVGVDQKGDAYVCYPQKTTNARRFESGPARTLDEAIRMDETLGRERIISLLCKTPRSIAEIKKKLEEKRLGLEQDKVLPQLYDDCEQREVSLVKK